MKSVMENFLIDWIGSLFEFLAVAAGIWLVAVSASIGFLYTTPLYRARGFALATPSIVALSLSVFGLISQSSMPHWTDHEWVYYLLPPPILSSWFVSESFRRLLICQQ